MSNLGDEYKTEFGEFLDFQSEYDGGAPYRDPNEAFIPLSEINVEQSYVFGQIEAIAQEMAQSTAQAAN